MSFQKIGDFESQFQTPNYVRWENIQGGVITAQEFVLAGGTTGVIRSQDYAPASAGWAIFGDGSAEFAGNLSIGGSLTVTNDIILSGSGRITTASSGERMEMTTNAYLTIYDSAGTVVGYLGYAPTGYGADDLVLATVAGLDNVVVDSDALITLQAGGSAGRGVTVQSSPAGGFPGEPFVVANGAGSTYYLKVTDSPQVQVPDGSVGTPGVGFLNDTNTGMFRSGADDGRLVAGGSSIAQFTSGRFGPGTDNAISLGGSGLRWTEVFAVNGTINTSDARYKKNIRDLDYGLDFINRLRPVKFRWRKSKDKSLHWGLLAQELAEHTTSGPYREGEILGINYAELVPALIKAVQELSAEVEALRKGG